jgi:cytochrome c biogenesis protein CcmG/thiol:disulfide interchange protein DsbE
MASENAIRWAKALVLLAAAGVLMIAISIPVFQRAGSVRAAGKRKAVPDFRLSDLSGKPWRLSDHRGEIVVVNFWATWCGPCQEETPGLIRLSRHYAGKGVAFVGISTDDDPASVIPPFLQEFQIPYPIVLAGPNVSLAENIDGLPTTYLLDRQGRIAKKLVGATDEAEFRQEIDALLNEPA